MKPGAFLLAMLLVSACTPRPDVAAMVNGRGIPIEQFRQVLARNTSPNQPSDPRQLLESIVNRELLVEKAEELKLDRSLPVAQAIEAARADILAQVYVEHALGARPSAASDIVQFYRDHPALFAQRRIYRIFELAVMASPEQVPALRQLVEQAKGLYEVAEWLSAHDIRFNVGGVTKPSEHLAPALLQRVSGMTVGQLAIIDVPGGASIVQLVHSEGAPLSQEQATPIIEALLRARKRAEVAEREVKFLRGRAAIQYLVDLGGDPEAPVERAAAGPGT